MPNIQSEIPSDLSPYTQSAHSCLHVFVYAVLFTWIFFSIPFICKSSPFLISSFSSFFFSMSISSFSPFFPSLPNNHKTPMIIKSWLAINDYLKESHKAIIHAINRSYLNDLSFENFFLFYNLMPKESVLKLLKARNSSQILIKWCLTINSKEFSRRIKNKINFCDEWEHIDNV